MINLEVDGKPVQVEQGATVMEAANKVGAFVPHFCYHKKLSIAANCRMCLVQVEKAPKPLPACATPATEGMKVFTHSDQAVTAQKGVMEFLLINHPLDCPICDQGGECQLQDLAVGYGGSASRYEEEKRVVVNKNLGPLISTDMTRCIHCTRCVRFGQEVAGVMELGMAGRGEHSEILAFVGRTVDSELSGNMIDLCPVGALTSKPFRYSARTWELSRRKTVSPHDSLASGLVAQVKLDRVLRVLPREDENLNECWISDRDRFAYEGLNAVDRLTHPMVKRNGAWVAVDWSEAMAAAVAGLKGVALKHGSSQLAIAVSPAATLEEMSLAKKLADGLGTDAIDVRLRRRDLRGKAKGAAWLGMKVAAIADLKSVLLVGSTLRKEHPLLANRFRQAAKKGQQVNVLHVAGDDLLMRVANSFVVRPSGLARALAEIVKAACEAKGSAPSAQVAAVTPSAQANAIAASLVAGEASAVLLGNYAQQHPEYAVLRLLAQELARVTGATLGILPDGGNAVGGEALGLVSKGALAGRKAYVLFGVEHESDTAAPAEWSQSLNAAEFTVALSAYRPPSSLAAHVMLPIVPFTETGGSLANMEGRVQSFNAVVKPLGEARPGWKVLRVLGSALGLPGFEAETLEHVRAGIAPDIAALVAGRLDNQVESFGFTLAAPGSGLERVAEVPLYAGDAVVRRAASLQRTADGRAGAKVRMNAATAAAHGLAAGDTARITQGGGSAQLTVAIDAALADGCVRVAMATEATSLLGEGALTLAKSASERAA
jgi:NADH-quinone oxidoreductase subunit G